MTTISFQCIIARLTFVMYVCMLLFFIGLNGKMSSTGFNIHVNYSQCLCKLLVALENGTRWTVVLALSAVDNAWPIGVPFCCY